MYIVVTSLYPWDRIQVAIAVETKRGVPTMRSSWMVEICGWPGFSWMMIKVNSHMKEKIVEYSCANIVTHWKINKKVIELNSKLRSLLMSLSFWVRLVLCLYLRPIMFSYRDSCNSITVCAELDGVFLRNIDSTWRFSTIYPLKNWELILFATYDLHTSLHKCNTCKFLLFEKKSLGDIYYFRAKNV